MSEAVVPRPSYRVEREASSFPWRILGIAGGVLLVTVLGAGGWWAFRSLVPSRAGSCSEFASRSALGVSVRGRPAVHVGHVRRSE